MKLRYSLALATAMAVPAVYGADQCRPNILLFLVDDMGWQDTSLPFYSERTPLNDRYRTPNMERLAARGVKFTSAYACSISSPSRCSLMTGMNAARHRVTNWTLHRGRQTDEPQSDLILPQWNVNGIQPTDSIELAAPCTTFVELLRRSGYHTIHCGKAHFGAIGTPSADPLTMGFDVNICGHAGGGLASYLGERRYGHDAEGRPVSPFAVPGLEAYWDTDVFATEALTREAVKALDEARDAGSPWFLYMSHYAVHVPIEADRRFVDKYIDAGLSATEAAYASLVEGMDKSLGDMLDWLERTGEAENTVVMFMSDNGGLSALGRTPPYGVHNAPLRSGKGSVYEGGVREPMIVSWPGVTAPGSEIDEYVMIEDFFPTILEMAGCADAQSAAVQMVDGISFIPMLTGQGENPAHGRSIYWHTPNSWIAGDYRDQGIGATSAVRRGDYKLVYWWIDSRKELYDLRADIGESNDLAAAMPELVAELSADLGEYLRSVDAQRPKLASTGEYCQWPDEVVD